MGVYDGLALGAIRETNDFGRIVKQSRYCVAPRCKHD